MNKKVYNQKKIIELYEDYNLRREKNKELIKKIEKECGYTYVPSILHKNILDSTADTIFCHTICKHCVFYIRDILKFKNNISQKI